jgi:hypothetical protein
VRNRELIEVIAAKWPRVVAHFSAGEPLVEISRRS